MNTEYAQLLKDPKWDAFRRRILQQADYRCECCGHTDKTLQVHHLYYDLSKKPWQYKDNHVACLCKECHKFSHKLLQQGWKPLTLDTLANISYYDEKEGELADIVVDLLRQQNDINAKLFLARREYRDVCDQLSELNMQEQNSDESIEDEQLEDTGM